MWPGKATSGPLCGLARPHQAPLWPGKATSGLPQARSGPGRPPAGPGRPPAGRRKAGFCPDPARAGGRKGRVWLSGSGWPRMLPARPLGPSGALLGPSRGPWGPKWAPGPPWGPPWGPALFPLRDGRCDDLRCDDLRCDDLRWQTLDRIVFHSLAPDWSHSVRLRGTPKVTICRRLGRGSG